MNIASVVKLQEIEKITTTTMRAATRSTQTLATKVMRAVQAPTPGGPSALKVLELAIPEPGPDQVLIKVAAAGINRPDCLQREGKYPPPRGAPLTLGLELSGRVVAVGPHTSDETDTTRSFIKEGDRVCALVPGGGYAEYCLAHRGSCLRAVVDPVPLLPKALKHLNLSKDPMVRAAAVPETVLTVWKNLFSSVQGSNSAQLQSGQTLLVHGGASGIGTTAIQLAVARGLKVYATAGSQDKCDLACALGASAAFNYRDNADWNKLVKEHNGGNGVDCVLDFIGGEYMQRNLDVLAMFGKLVIIGFLGSAVSTVNMAPVLLKSIRITGSTLRAQSDKLKSELVNEITEEVLPLLRDGRFVPIVLHNAVFDGLDNAVHAHEAMDNATHAGKVVLSVNLLDNTSSI